MSITFHSDQLLWNAFKAGNRDALSNLFKTYYPILYRYGQKIHNNHHEVEENIQEFFLYLYERRARLTTPDSIKSYLLKSFRRRLLNHLEQSRSHRKRMAQYADQLVDIQFSVDEIMVRQEVSDHIRHIFVDMLNALPKRQREVIYLRYYDQLTIAEVAQVLSISYQGAVNTAYKAIKALRTNETLSQISAFI
ncbi:MAG: sigma-70 family RNA polymerase sigma factor [Saprospiraceae bacterium]|nr:sigma-70 family RNA polymerase sigma factor [Saprospiraceae bacterium]